MEISAGLITHVYSILKKRNCFLLFKHLGKEKKNQKQNKSKNKDTVVSGIQVTPAHQHAMGQDSRRAGPCVKVQGTVSKLLFGGTI